MWYAKVVCELLILAQGNRWNCIGKGTHDSVISSEWGPDIGRRTTRRLMEEEEAAVPGRKRCAHPACSEPTSVSRLQRLPEDITGDCIPGAKHFHRQKAACVLGGVGSWMLQRKRGESGLLRP